MGLRWVGFGLDFFLLKYKDKIYKERSRRVPSLVTHSQAPADSGNKKGKKEKEKPTKHIKRRKEKRVHSNSNPQPSIATVHRNSYTTVVGSNSYSWQQQLQLVATVGSSNNFWQLQDYSYSNFWQAATNFGSYKTTATTTFDNYGTTATAQQQLLVGSNSNFWQLKLGNSNFLQHLRDAFLSLSLPFFFFFLSQWCKPSQLNLSHKDPTRKCRVRVNLVSADFLNHVA